jgi:competence protein ComEC
MGGITGTTASARVHWHDRLAQLFAVEQERWFLWVPVLFGAGIAFYFGLSDEPAVLAVAALVVAAVCLAVIAPTRGLWQPAIAMVVALVLGGAAAKFATERAAAPRIERPLDTVVEGFVERVEPRTSSARRVMLWPTAIEGLARDELPRTVRITLPGSGLALTPGLHIRVRTALGPPPDPVLPGDFDFARAAYFQALGGIGFTRAHPELAETAIAPPVSLRVRAAIETLRDAINRRIWAVLPGEVGQIAAALITGERGGISQSTNQLYRDSGLFHILSISGLHMVIMAGAVFVSLRFLLALVPRLALDHAIKKWAAVGALIGALGYLLISGVAFATVRSYIMVTIMLLAVLFDRPALALRNVALAALVILVIWPQSLLDPGFQMSFATTTAIIAAFEAWHERRRTRDHEPLALGVLGRLVRAVGAIMATTLVASLAVAPFAIYHFHTSQQFALLANVLAIPICNLIVMPAALASLVAMAFGLEALPLMLMGIGIDAMTWVAGLVAALPGAVVRVRAIPTQSFALLVCGGIWLVLWSRSWRWLALIPVAVGLALAPTLPRPDLIVGRSGTVVVRGADGRLVAGAGRGAAFELRRWLEADGDARQPAEILDGRALDCDAAGCVTNVRGVRLAIATSAAALADDCARADLLITRTHRPAGCVAPSRVISGDDITRRGTHTVYLTPTLRVETVAAARGHRPWTRQP